jgi:uncharacterized repeat protein (TIGR01451 family)
MCVLAAGVVTCNAATLASGASFAFHVSSTTTAETAGDSPVTNSACVTTANDGQPCSEDHVDVSLLTIDKTNNAPLKALVLPDGSTKDVPTAGEGTTVTYTLTYHVGNAVTAGVITDVLPAGVQYVIGSATSNAEFTFSAYDSTTRTLSWTANSVTEGGTLTYQALVLTGASELSQPLVNTATIDSEQTGPDSDTSDIFVPVSPKAETAPPTDVLVAPEGTSGPGSSLVLILGILGMLVVGLGFITPVPAAVRRRNHR